MAKKGNTALLQAKINPEEEADLIRLMALEGMTNRSDFVRKRVFGIPGRNDVAMGNLLTQVATLTDQVAAMDKTIRMLVAVRQDDTPMKLLAAIYMMLHPSVEITAQSSVDQYIDFDSVVGFLQDGNKPKKGSKR